VPNATAFHVAIFTEAMVEALGVERKTVKVNVIGFLVSVSYELPSAIIAEQLAFAIAASTGASEEDVKVKIAAREATNTRRLATITLPGFTVEAEVQVADAATAMAIKTKIASTDTLKLELAKMGVIAEPLIKLPPSVAVKTEMKITTVNDSMLQVPSSSKIASVAAVVGGTVTLTGGTLLSTTSTTTSPQDPSGSTAASPLVPSVSTTTPHTPDVLHVTGKLAT